MILDNEFTGDLRVENEIIALRKAGHDVSLLCLNFGTKKNYEEFYGAKIYRIPINLSLKKKLAGLNNTIFNFYPIFWKKQIRKFVKDNKIEALHVHDLWLLEGALLANKTLNVPIIADLHENFVDALSHYKYANKLPGKFLISKKRWAKSEREWVNKVDRLITVIEEAVPRYEQLGVDRKKIFVVPNYVNLKTFLENDFDENILKKYEKFFTVIYTGGFDLHRGLETLVKAGAILKEKINNLKIVLVGSGSNLSSLQMFVETLGLNETVIFEGWQNPNKLSSYIKSAKIGIIPHLKTVHTDNTIPHKLFQYMYLEKAVVASDCNPLKRILNETNAGVYFKSGDEKDLAEKILFYYNNEQLRIKAGLSGKQAVLKKYNWETAAKNLISVYKSLEINN